MTSILSTIQDALMLRNGSVVAGISVSVKKSESHDLSAETTDFALESGATVSDHIILKPIQVSVEIGMTNAGLFAVEAARDTHAAFKEMRNRRELVTLATEHDIYENMAIINVSPLHQAPFKGAFTCTLNFKQISFVELQSAGRAAAKGKASKTGSGPVNSGKVEPKPVDKSKLGKIFDQYGKKG